MRELPNPISAIAAVNDPQRRALYQLISANDEPMTRDQAAEAMGIPRATAAFHLERLVSEGLLATEFRKLSGKDGPGSGRPSKLYRLARDEFTVSIPPRNYELAGELLAAAVGEADATGDPVRDVVSRVATAKGIEHGAEAGSLPTALSASGYEPCEDEEGGLVLANCPFHRLASRHADVICHANREYLRGVARGAGDDADRIEFVVPEGHCCVRIAPSQ
ncbi:MULTISPECIES: metalloregulator ArsR/SmtB family transcription factor [unclassified Cryobacterium]|uniref:helix-turn-helix transcriptional regulator n=1 Tax=unclassified Cryobacterium TaxID=2649013 RepID=UPI0014483184|nr:MULTISPECIES: helix-turn-helix domain-containing protein [unclassified Cryobacterium]